MKVYISGKIDGLNFDEVKEKFDAAETKLKAQGFEVVSPLKTGVPSDAGMEIHISIDIILLIGCDAIYLIKDWSYSKGATLEKNLAETIGKKIIYQEVQKFVELKQVILEVMGISFYEIAGESRKRRYVYARMIFAHYCIEQGGTITEIAVEMNRKNHNHSTIIYYLNKFNDDKRYNSTFKHIVESIENALSKNLKTS